MASPQLPYDHAHPEALALDAAAIKAAKLAKFALIPCKTCPEGQIKPKCGFMHKPKTPAAIPEVHASDAAAVRVAKLAWRSKIPCTSCPKGQGRPNCDFKHDGTPVVIPVVAIPTPVAVPMADDGDDSLDDALAEFDAEVEDIEEIVKLIDALDDNPDPIHHLICPNHEACDCVECTLAHPLSMTGIATPAGRFCPDPVCTNPFHTHGLAPWIVTDEEKARAREYSRIQREHLLDEILSVRPAAQNVIENHTLMFEASIPLIEAALSKNPSAPCAEYLRKAIASYQ